MRSEPDHDRELSGGARRVVVCHVVRPFSSNPSREIVAAPKVYGFDTGFVCYYRQWDRLRREDRGILWEHLVLDELMARLQVRNVRYWRDKNGYEIDFVLAGRRSAPVAIECKCRRIDGMEVAFETPGTLASAVAKGL